MTGDEDGMLKLLVDPEDRSLLGVHVIGTGATELVHIGQAVMAQGAGGLDFLVTAVFNYPTFAESYKVAALDAANRIRGMHRRVELPDSSPGRRRVVLEEDAADVLARLAAHDRVVDAGGAVGEVERGVEALLGEPHLRGVRALVGDPAGVDAGHEDAVGRPAARARSCA